MDLIIVLLALGLLMFVAYKGYSVILFAPLCALLAVLLTNPYHMLPFFSEVFMLKMSGFIKSYFAVFLLGAIFGKVIELSGIAEIIAKFIVRVIGAKNAIAAIVLLCALLTYSGVSLFVVVFAVYPFAKKLFQEANITKRLIPGTIALGAFSFTMDALPGTPQIQNVIPTPFFKTDIYAAPILGVLGSIFVLILGLTYLEWRKRKSIKNGEGYYGVKNEIEENEENVEYGEDVKGLKVLLAFLPLVLVAVTNRVLTTYLPKIYGEQFKFDGTGVKDTPPIEIKTVTAIWSLESALLLGILAAILFNFKRVTSQFKVGVNAAISGSLLAVMNTGAEYGFGGVIAALPGFKMISNGISSAIDNPLINGAVTTTVLAGVTGSASGGMSIALGVMGESYVKMIEAANISPEVMHRVISMASGGMDTLPHNGAVITLLAVTGLTHKQSYKDIFAVTIIKTLAVFFIIGIYSLTGLV